ncbi:MAG: hypothetical protein IJ400_06960 [Clostridia bacterium]|nr:hypothetical protein [Clostridia bacterium]
MKEKIVNKIQEKLNDLGLASLGTTSLIAIAIITGSIWLFALPFVLAIMGGTKCNNSESVGDYLVGILLIVTGLLLGAVVAFVVLSIKYALNR